MDIIICENCEEYNEYGIKYCKNCGHELYYCDEEENFHEESISENEVNEGNDSITVNLPIDEAVKKIELAYIGLSFSIEKKSVIKFSNEKKCVVFVCQKYFYRVNNYVAVTIILNNASGNTNIDVISTGGGDSILPISWGAEEAFKQQIEKIFEKYQY